MASAVSPVGDRGPESLGLDLSTEGAPLHGDVAFILGLVPYQSLFDASAMGVQAWPPLLLCPAQLRNVVPLEGDVADPRLRMVVVPAGLGLGLTVRYSAVGVGLNSTACSCVSISLCHKGLPP